MLYVPRNNYPNRANKKELDTNKFTWDVFIDLQKAFDILNYGTHLS